MYEWLESIKIGLGLILLFYASRCDYKYREVSNKVWAVFAPSGLMLTLSYILLTQQFFLVTTLVVSLLIVGGISVALFYMGFFGGADAKALICLAMAFPYYPVSLKSHLRAISYFFPLSVFGNAIITSALSVVVLVVYNVMWRVKTGKTLFEGLERESSSKKFLALITGYKVELAEIERKPHLVPLEEVSEGEDGKVTRNLRVFVSADEDREARIARVDKFSGKLDGEIWVTPNLPFIIFITIGFVVAVLRGDIILWLTTLLTPL